MYKIVQTGAKNQFGGLKNGFSIVKNQVSTEERVTKLDKSPTAIQAEMEMIILFRLAFFKSSFFSNSIYQK